eukprot:15366720-Ditylum_brightwellii.AAC.1
MYYDVMASWSCCAPIRCPCRQLQHCNGCSSVSLAATVYLEQWLCLSSCQTAGQMSVKKYPWLDLATLLDVIAFGECHLHP